MVGREGREARSTHKSSPSHAIRLSGSLDDSEILRPLNVRVVIWIEAVGALLVIVVSGNNTQVDVMDTVTKLRCEVGETSQRLGAGKSEGVSRPKDAFAVHIVRLARGEKANSNLWSAFCLCNGEVLGFQLQEGVNDGIFGNQCILHDAKYHLDRQMRQPMSGLVQSGEAGAAATSSA